jgi:hypothetical protein
MRFSRLFVNPCLRQKEITQRLLLTAAGHLTASKLDAKAVKPVAATPALSTEVTASGQRS